MPKNEITDFITNPVQNVVVTGIVQHPYDQQTDIVCFSPVWKAFVIKEPNSHGIERGDILVVSRSEKIAQTSVKSFEYKILRNRTMEAILNNGTKAILQQFNKNEQKFILAITEPKIMELLNNKKTKQK